MRNKVRFNDDGSLTTYDVFGRPINVGDKIIYSAADGRSSVLRRGVVRDIYLSTEEEVRLSVDADRFSRGEWKPVGRRVTLSFLNRIMRVDNTLW